LFDDENSVLKPRMPVFARLKVRIEAAMTEMEVGETRQQGFFSETAERQAAGVRKLGLKMKDTYKADGTKAASAEEN